VLVAALFCPLWTGPTRAQPREPLCVVTYEVNAAREISVTGARCDTRALEPAALAFALARLDGPFRELLAAQAPIEVEFTYSESLIRAHAEGSGAI
jgi:hypothetical protein